MMDYQSVFDALRCRLVAILYRSFVPKYTALLTQNPKMDNRNLTYNETNQIGSNIPYILRDKPETSIFL